MEEKGLLEDLVRGLQAMVPDVKALVESTTYKERLRQCLIHPYSREVLADFLVLDNPCRALITVAGGKDNGVILWGLWEARKQVFEEVRRAADLVIPDGVCGDRALLYVSLLNLSSSKRTADDVWELLEASRK